MGGDQGPSRFGWGPAWRRCARGCVSLKWTRVRHQGCLPSRCARFVSSRVSAAELERTIEVLKAVASFFARECDPLSR